MEASSDEARRRARRGNASRALALGAGLWSATACSSGADGASNQLEPGQAMTISGLHGRASGQVRVDGDTLTEGRNAFLVELSPSGTVLTGASALMPAHGHGSPSPAVITQTATGYRVSDLIFSMPGLWDVFLDVDAAGQADRIEFSVDVP